jgi:ABC-2 type transport system ATP-binding protein
MSIMPGNGSLPPMAIPVTGSAPRDAPAVECRDLVVRYGGLTAVDGLSLEAHPGQVLALLGPNGAGKTSTVETLEGYRRPTGGTVRVLGFDPRAERRRVVARIGTMLQRGGVYPTMAARRVLRLFAAYYDDPEDPDALLDAVGLSNSAGTPWRRLSGGEQQRLSLALAVVGRPDVVFLDEPTAGVDPEGRDAVRRVVDELRARGACVILTTHELPEAERVADEVLIIARGRAAARGTVAALAGGDDGGGITFVAPPALDTDAVAAAVDGEPGTVTETSPGHFRVAGPPTPGRLAALAGWMEKAGVPVSDLRAGSRSLEDAYRRAVHGTAEDDTPHGDTPEEEGRSRGR